MYHGDTRKTITETNGGNTSFIKREKYCCRHGWVDVFWVGGEGNWQSQHGLCGAKPKHGAEFEQPKVLKKAA